jgi:hypothetical protein
MTRRGGLYRSSRRNSRGVFFPAQMNQYCANIVIMNVIVALEASSVKRILLQCKTRIDVAEILRGMKCELSLVRKLA